jgi:hypothetical protein
MERMPSSGFEERVRFCGHRLFKGPPWLFRCEVKAIADGWACPCVRELSFVLKRKKGIWWMPWYREAMKDVAPCDKLRGDGSNL